MVRLYTDCLVLGAFPIMFLPLLVHSLNQEAGKSLDAFQRDCLDAHNTYRSQHGVPPLVWSAELAEHAQKWADILASKDEIKHDMVAMSKNDEGENLAFFRPAVPKCQGSMVDSCVLCREMVKRWYDEAKHYDYDSGKSTTPDRATKHFSQIIWASTSEVGIGTAISKKFGFITVARYRPQGNKGGPAVFVTNIPPEGGPLPSLSFSDSPLNSSASTTPTGNGIPITESTTGIPEKAISSSNQPGPSLNGVLLEIQRKPAELNDEIENKNTNKEPALLAKIRANQRQGKKKKDKTGPNINQANQNAPTIYTNQANQNAPTINTNQANQNAPNLSTNQANQNKPTISTNPESNENHNGDEESNFNDHMTKDFDYENGQKMYEDLNNDRNGVDNGGRDTFSQDKNIDSSEYSRKNNGDDGEEQEHIGVHVRVNKGNTQDMVNQPTNNNIDIHTDDGLISNELQKDLANKGLVRTVQGPDGTSAQVFLTKNGAHAGLVFRDQISRVSSSDNSLETGPSKRIIDVL